MQSRRFEWSRFSLISSRFFVILPLRLSLFPFCNLLILAYPTLSYWELSPCLVWRLLQINDSMYYSLCLGYESSRSFEHHVQGASNPPSHRNIYWTRWGWWHTHAPQDVDIACVPLLWQTVCFILISYLFKFIIDFLIFTFNLWFLISFSAIQATHFKGFLQKRSVQTSQDWVHRCVFYRKK